MDFTLVGLWNEMGIVARAVVLVLVAMSLYSLAITGDRLRTFRRGRKLSRLYIAALAPMVEGPGRLREAVGLDKRFAGSPVASVIGAGPHRVRARCRPTAGARRRAVRGRRGRQPRHGAEQGAASWPACAAGMPVLATVASSAPFVGLFGTVGGIITAFQKLADPTKGGGGIGTVSAGIAEALVTTAVGLGVAIIAVWFYNYFTARLDDMTIDIDETASELVDTILRGQPA